MSSIFGLRYLKRIVFLNLLVFSWHLAAEERDKDKSKAPKESYETLIIAPRAEQISRQRMQKSTQPSVAQMLLDQTSGVSTVQRSTGVIEPVIRGLSGERVTTRVGPVMLYGACPSKMDPPINYLFPQAIDAFSIDKDSYSLSDGPVGLGGALNLSLDYQRKVPKDDVHALVGMLFNSARNGGLVTTSLYGGTKRLDMKASAQFLRFGDYDAPSGEKVDADQTQSGASLSLGWRLNASERIYGAFYYRNEQNVDYPALPMDNINTNFYLYTMGYQNNLRGRFFKQLKIDAGLSWVDHLMTNEKKPNMVMMHAETPAETRSYGLRAKAIAQKGIANFAMGYDANLLFRDAIRSRYMLAQKAQFFDHIWPNAVQIDHGLYFEGKLHFRKDLHLAFGLRGDLVYSDANAVHDASLGGKSVVEQYIVFNGSDAEKVDDLETLGSTNLRLIYRPHSDWRFSVGSNISMRAAGITERYFAFAPAPGGFQIGNPTLSAEKKMGFDASIRYRSKYLSAELNAYSNWIKDYIIAETIALKDFNMDGIEDRLRGFRNVSAFLVGGEFKAELKPHRWVSVPIMLSYVWAENQSDDRPIAEIPPLFGKGALRVGNRINERFSFWSEGGIRFAAAQNRIDTVFGENESDEWMEIRFEAGLRYRSIWLIISGENLANTTYHQHLTREAIFANGSYPAGREIPAMGRRVMISLTTKI